MKNKLTKFGFFTAIVLCLLVLVFDTNAQTKRRKKKVNRPPVVSQTQPPTAPAVISENGQYLDGNQIVFGETLPTQPTTEPQTTEETVSTTDAEGETNTQIKELNSRIKKLESTKKGEYDQKQQRLLLNLDILSRAESRAESLRKQLFEMIEKENSVKTRLEQIQYDARPELIDRSVALVGSFRPEELRDQRKKSLEAEKRNLESLLTQIQTSRTTLESNVEKADALVEKVRSKLDKEIDDALAAEESNQ
ncbi:MAG: hypothetical protein H7Z37_10190 [Pyrinomonadaceae bacterium]|nr:hypothetical protein [Pyrinomonadaceae bacterium]